MANLTLTATEKADGSYAVTDGGSYAKALVNGDTSSNAPISKYAYKDGQFIVLMDGIQVGNSGTTVGNYSFTYSGTVVPYVNPEPVNPKPIGPVNPEPVVYPVKPITDIPVKWDSTYDFMTDLNETGVANLNATEIAMFSVTGGSYRGFGSYTLTETANGLRMKPSAKRTPAPERQNSVRRVSTGQIALNGATGEFVLAYDGTALDVYPSSAAEKGMLQNINTKAMENIALQAASNAMQSLGVLLADMKGICVHADETMAESEELNYKQAI